MILTERSLMRSKVKGTEISEKEKFSNACYSGIQKHSEGKGTTFSRNPCFSF
jgi:hypothetical protein